MPFFGRRNKHSQKVSFASFVSFDVRHILHKIQTRKSSRARSSLVFSAANVFFAKKLSKSHRLKRKLVYCLDVRACIALNRIVYIVKNNIAQQHPYNNNTQWLRNNKQIFNTARKMTK